MPLGNDKSVRGRGRGVRVEKTGSTTLSSQGQLTTQSMNGAIKSSMLLKDPGFQGLL